MLPGPLASWGCPHSNSTVRGRGSSGAMHAA